MFGHQEMEEKMVTHVQQMAMRLVYTLLLLVQLMNMDIRLNTMRAVHLKWLLHSVSIQLLMQLTTKKVMDKW